MPAPTDQLAEAQPLAQRIAAALQNDQSEDPLYRRLAAALRGLIAGGHLRNRDSLPSERRLAEATGLSRVTVRKALEELVDGGLVERRAGARSHVAQDMDQSLSVLMGFTADMRRRGTVGHSVLLHKITDMPTPDEVLKLGISLGEQVLRLSRVRLADGEPLAVEHAVVPAFAVAGALGDSLYEALRQNGYRPYRALQRLRVALADADEAAHLLIPPGSPILHIERHTFMENGRPIEVTRSSYRGDRYDFVAELQIDD
ncbi:GntR family transcriptional regulator [Ketogulonicigenium vulgare]|uniref:GntR family transcriptional regulator n=1 Tax=Ketogulonicigenium vulgare TaxID=92945 RepID=UPI00235A0278|nr:GntR family transcriptional regulator [Ketogulonicigenium vulgare]